MFQQKDERPFALKNLYICDHEENINKWHLSFRRRLCLIDNKQNSICSPKSRISSYSYFANKTVFSLNRQEMLNSHISRVKTSFSFFLSFYYFFVCLLFTQWPKPVYGVWELTILLTKSYSHSGVNISVRCFHITSPANYVL